MLCSYITWLGRYPFRFSFASGLCLHGRDGRNERECFGYQHRATRFDRNASHHVNELTNFNGGEAFVSAALRPKRHQLDFQPHIHHGGVECLLDQQDQRGAGHSINVPVPRGPCFGPHQWAKRIQMHNGSSPV